MTTFLVFRQDEQDEQDGQDFELVAPQTDVGLFLNFENRKVEVQRKTRTLG